MSKVAAALHETIDTVAPDVIEGVSVGRVGDKATWSIQFKADATDEQKAAALAVVTAFNAADVREPLVVDFAGGLERLSDDEWVALQNACIASVPLARVYERAKVRGRIDLNDLEVRTTLTAVVDAKLFTRERLAEVFGVKQLP